MEQNHHIIRSNMRRIRETTPVNGKKPISLREMADKLGMPSGSLSRFETGKSTSGGKPDSPFRHSMVIKYAEILDVPIALFYQLEPKKTPCRQDLDLLDINNRRYEDLAQTLSKTQARLKKTLRLVQVQTLMLKEQQAKHKTFNKVRRLFK